MDETAYSVPMGDDGADGATMLLAAPGYGMFPTSERNRYRLSGLKLAAVLSLGLWAAIAYGVWSAVHAMA